MSEVDQGVKEFLLTSFPKEVAESIMDSVAPQVLLSLDSLKKYWLSSQHSVRVQNFIEDIMKQHDNSKRLVSIWFDTLFTEDSQCTSGSVPSKRQWGKVEDGPGRKMDRPCSVEEKVIA